MDPAAALKHDQLCQIALDERRQSKVEHDVPFHLSILVHLCGGAGLLTACRKPILVRDNFSAG